MSKPKLDPLPIGTVVRNGRHLYASLGAIDTHETVLDKKATCNRCYRNDHSHTKTRHHKATQAWFCLGLEANIAVLQTFWDTLMLKRYPPYRLSFRILEMPNRVLVGHVVVPDVFWENLKYCARDDERIMNLVRVGAERAVILEPRKLAFDDA